jgi:hypothetical protein
MQFITRVKPELTVDGKSSCINGLLFKSKEDSPLIVEGLKVVTLETHQNAVYYKSQKPELTVDGESGCIGGMVGVEQRDGAWENSWHAFNGVLLSSR